MRFGVRGKVQFAATLLIGSIAIAETALADALAREPGPAAPSPSRDLVTPSQGTVAANVDTKKSASPVLSFAAAESLKPAPGSPSAQPKSGTPYGGTPWPIPGTIEAENFNDGGLWTAYYDNSAGNQFGAYRATDVDIAAIPEASNGHAVRAFYSGEWMNYTITVPRTDAYNFSLRYSQSQGISASGYLEIPQLNLSMGFTLPPTWAVNTFAVAESAPIAIPAGTHVIRFRIEATQAPDIANINIDSIQARISQTPYGGTLWPVPGRIEAENFDVGGNGIAYGDTAAGNSGGAYRLADWVDILANPALSNGHTVGLTANEWMEWSVNAAQTGNYQLNVRYATGAANGLTHFYVNDVDVTAQFWLPGTGSFSAYSTASRPTIRLNAGRNEIRIFAPNSNDFHLDFIEFVGPIARGPWGGTPATVPGRIQAEHYDLGGQEVAYYDTVPGNQGGYNFRGDDVDTHHYGDSDGTPGIGWNTTPEWTEYTVNVTQASNYYINLRAANGVNALNPFRVTRSGVTLGGTINVPFTGSWSTHATVASGVFSLPAGQQVLRVVSDSPWGLAFNWFELVRVNTPPSCGVSVTPAVANAPATFTLNATASDSDGSIARVDFYNGATLVASDTTAPYSADVANLPAGTYTLSARCIDNDGGLTAATPVPARSNALPSIVLNQPANGFVHQGAPGTIVFQATASDSDGSIVTVHFYNGGTFLGADDTAPYGFTWTNVPAGSYAVAAYAIDNNSGVTGYGANITVNPLPTATLTAPANGTVIQGAPGTISIAANATDANGSISRVDFYNGAALLGSDTTAPYQFTWSNVAAGTYTINAYAVDNHGGTSAASSASVVVNALPSASISTPAAGTRFTPPASITINASASDSDGTIAQVEFFNGARLIGADTTSPFSAVDANLPLGTYSLTVRATDNRGGISPMSPAVSVEVVNNVPPTVLITSPSNNASFTPPATINIAANASDDSGVTKVEFFNGSTLLSTDNSAPYSYAWTNIATGSYILTARATDNQSATTTSAPITVVVNQPPIVTLLSPAITSYAFTPGNVIVHASANDADGGVTKVEFFRNGALIATDTTAPYFHEATGLASGQHVFSARAYDAYTSAGSSSATVTAASEGPKASFPSFATCDTPLVPIAAGTNPTTPGRWWNPKRAGTGWDFFYTNTESKQVLVIYWYTLNDLRQPEWLYATSDVDPGQTQVAATLYRRHYLVGRINPATGQPYQQQYRNDPAGSIALTLNPANPTQVAVTWKYDQHQGGSVGETECLQDFLRPGLTQHVQQSNATVGMPPFEVGSAFSGTWYEHTVAGGQAGLPGYASQVTIQRAESGNWWEMHMLTVFDTVGAPVWIDSQSGSTNIPTSSVTSFNLTYYYSNYPRKLPIDDCDSNGACVTGIPAGSLTRTVLSANEMEVQVNAALTTTPPSGQNLVWRRGSDPYGNAQTGTLQGTVRWSRYTQADVVSVDRLECSIGDSQTNCPVQLSWTSLNPDARAFRRDLVTGSLSGPLVNSTTGQSGAVGARTELLGPGARVQFELHNSSTPGTIIFRTPEIRAIDVLAPAMPEGPDTRSISASDASEQVGATPGQFRVDESGSATYSISIFVPPGRGGMEPELGLTYSSAGRDGYLGTGWELTGVSGISRCRKGREYGDGPGYNYPPILLKAETGAGPAPSDQFCLDGMRLVHINPATAAHGTAGAEYRTEIESWRRVVVESSRLVAIEGNPTHEPQSFLVYGKDGTIKRFGDQTDGAGNVQGENRSGRHLGQVGVSVAVLAWAQTSLKDTVGNEIAYLYTRSADPRDGEQYLSEIRYVGGKVVLDTGPRAAGTAAVSYVGGAKVSRSRRYSEIKVYSQTQNASPGVYTSAPVRRYVLNYGTSPINSSSDRMLSLQECRDSVCLPPTQFYWEAHRADQTAGSPMLDVPFSQATVADSKFGNLRSFKYGDVNGDGRADLIWVNDNRQIRVAISTPFDTRTSDAAVSAPGGAGLDFAYSDGPVHSLASGVDDDRGWHLFDYDQDGRDDLLYLDGPSNARVWQIKLAINDALPARQSTFAASSVFASAPVSDLSTDSATGGLPVPAGSTEHRGMLADFNGDGLVDLMVSSQSQQGTGIFGVRYLGRRATTDPLRASVPYGFSAESVASIYGDTTFSGTSQECATGVISATTREHAEAFDANGDGLADLLLSLTAPASCGIAPPDYAPANNSLDDSDSAGETQTLRVMFVSLGEVAPNVTRFTRYGNARWQYKGTGEAVAEPVEDFKVSDINADGLVDIVHRKSGRLEWVFQLNTGQGFEAPRCVRPLAGAHPQNALNPGVCGTVEQFAEQNARAQLLDYDGDGGLDFWVPPCSLAVPTSGCARSTSPYAVFLWNGGGFAPTPINTPFLGQAGEIIDGTSWLRSFADLDADGYLDALYIRPALNGNADGNWIGRRVVDHHRARNVIGVIDNGLGHITNISYQPMTLRSVYERAYGAVGTMESSSPIFNVMAPVWLARSVSSSSPTIAEPAGMTQVWYQYHSLRTQSGGRGNLGFGAIRTFDQTRGVVTVTRYEDRHRRGGQGLATSTSSYLGSLPGGSACSTSSPSVLDGAQCISREPQCENAGCPGYTTVIGSHLNNWAILSGHSHVWRPLLIASWSYDPSLEQSARGRSQKFFTYDDYDNVTRAVSEYSGTTVSSTFGADTTHSETVSVYTNDTANWRLGRLVSSQTTTTRRDEQGQPGPLGPSVREVSFNYRSADGLLSSENVEGSSAGSIGLSTYHQYDSFGNKTATFTCSNDISEAACRGTTAANMNFRPSGATVQRYVRHEYDPLGRYIVRSYEPFAPPSGSVAVEVQVATYTRNDIGDVESATDANGVTTTTVYGKLGRKQFQISSLGASEETKLYRCGSGVTCPSEAVFVVHSQSISAQNPARHAAPPSWVFHDALSRPVLSVKQGFAANEFIGQRTYFDSSGRTVRQTDPYFVQFTPTSGSAWGTNGLAADGRNPVNNLPATVTEYDIRDRVTSRSVPAPGSGAAVTTYTYSGLSTTVTMPANGSGEIETRTEVRNGAGEILSVTDANGFQTSYTYWPTGELWKVTRTIAGQVHVTTTDYDVRGRKISMTDPDMGAWSYEYNAAGELIKQVSSRGQCTRMNYDGRGRMVLRRDYSTSSCTDMETPTHTAQWTFDAAIRDTTTARAYGALALEKLTEGASNDTIVREFKYDVRARQSRVITLQRAKEFWQDTTYDRFSRPFQSFFEARTDAMRRTGEYFEYSNHGYQVATRDAYGSTSGREYHRVLAMDARGQVLREQRGANPALETARTYDLNTGWLNVINSANRSIQDLRYDYDVLGNVRQRRDLTTPSGAPARNVVETLSYDKLQRLRTNAIAVNGTVGETRTTIYDGAANAQGPGNISQKDGRDYVYATRPAVCGAGAAPGPHAVSQITGSGITDYACYDAAGNQTHVYRQGIVQALREITYTTFNLPDSIKASQYSTDTRFGYGPNRERVWRGELNIYGAAYEETLFIGNAEVVIAGNTVTLRRYVAGSIVEQRKLANGLQTSRVRYLFNDALGSTSAVVEDTGAIANNGAMGFDPWGARRVLSTGSVLGAAERAGFPASETTRKGFTGHEQVDGADVIHMNGRIYDPLTARFLQADPMVQDPYNGQSFNRYTYVFNNPLIYTDPTGYWGRREQAYLRSIVAIGITIWFPGFATQAFGLTGFQTTVLTGFLAGSVQTGTLKGGLQGAFSAALFHGVGTKFGGAHWSIRAAAHGVAGGIMAEVQGGRFGHGFASAGSADLLAPVVQHAEGTGPGEAIARMIVGGTASVASGGKFANGAVTAAMSYAMGRIASGDGDGGGEPDPSSVADTAVYRNSDWLQSGALSVSCSGAECVMQANLSVSYDAAWSQGEVFQWMAQIDHAWNVSHYNFAEGIRYSSRVSLSFAAPGTRGDLHFGYQDLGFGSFARTRVGDGLIMMHTPVRGTAAHEFGHALGLRHFPNITGGMMSYASSRSVQPIELNRLITAYRFPYSAGYKR